MDTNLQALLEKANANLEAKTKEVENLTESFTNLKTEHDGLLEEVKQLKESGDVKAAQEAVEKIEELQEQLSDVRTKMNNPRVAGLPDDQKKALKAVAIKAVGEYCKSGSKQDIYQFLSKNSAEQFKSLNITNPDEGGRAVAEILSREVIEYAREYSPILNYVGVKSGMTRDYRELVLVTYPSVQEGIENVAGIQIAETTTQEYKEVRSHTFKVNAKPRVTDEAMAGTDIDIYSQLVRLLGRELGIYIAAQILYGDGQNKNARGILSSNRVDITDGTGESFKPTLAPDPDDARNHDFYPVKPTGVSGSIGADDKTIVDFVIDVCNELPTEHLAGAAWYMNRKTRGVFEKVRDAEDRPIFRMSYMDGVGTLMLNGYPVRIDDTLPDIAADSYFAMFGRLDRAFAMNNGDIDKMLLDPYTVDGCTVIKVDKEFFEMVQQSDAIIILAATTNSGA